MQILVLSSMPADSGGVLGDGPRMHQSPPGVRMSLLRALSAATENLLQIPKHCRLLRQGPEHGRVFMSSGLGLWRVRRGPRRHALSSNPVPKSASSQSWNPVRDPDTQDKSDFIRGLGVPGAKNSVSWVLARFHTNWVPTLRTRWRGLLGCDVPHRIRIDPISSPCGSRSWRPFARACIWWMAIALHHPFSMKT
jgi:hypothetical protein